MTKLKLFKTLGLQKALQCPLKRNKLYEWFPKECTTQNEQKNKNYKNLFETIKKNAKKMCYSNKLCKCTGDLKKTWNIMKDIIEKSKIKLAILLHKLTINKLGVYIKPRIADAFKNFFTNIGQSNTKTT